eukprot:TRINITY_DN11866_c2_g1_i1.p1 TRINITY_DN11866_c2_g1~~TRINITY_DN11866_c2_g1_i1.p1  ORF type:complete len:1094 (+),score=260.15 TRINITY_DN11866_c2_g1_i1:397-3678(+)
MEQHDQQGSEPLASSEKTVNDLMKHSYKPTDPPVQSSAVNDSQPIDVVSLDSTDNDDSSAMLTPSVDKAPGDATNEKPFSKPIRPSAPTSATATSAVDSHHGQAVESSNQDGSEPNSAETTSPPGDEADQELTNTGRPKRQATKKKVKSLQATEQPRRGSKPGPKPGRKKTSTKSEKVAASSSSNNGTTARQIADPFVHAHVHLQNDVDSEVLRILGEYRELLMQTMTSENAAFDSSQYSKADVKNALCTALSRSRDRVQQALRPQMQGGRTGPRGLRNTFMIRYEQELHQACANNDLDKVREMVEVRRVSPTALRHDNATPLGIACEAGAIEVVKYLLDCDVNVNQPTGPSKCTALHHAAGTNNIPLIKLLIKSAADRHAPDEEGISPLDMDGLNMATWVVLSNTPGPKGLAGTTARKRREEAIERRKQSAMREQQRKDRAKQEQKQRRAKQSKNGKRRSGTASPNTTGNWNGLSNQSADGRQGDDIRIVKPDLPPVAPVQPNTAVVGGQTIVLPPGVNPATVQAALRQLRILQQQQPAGTGAQSYVMSLPTTNGQSVLLTTNGYQVAFQTPVYVQNPNPGASAADPLLPRPPITIVNYPDGAYEKLQQWRQEVPDHIRTAKVWVHSEMALSFTNETEFLIGSNVNDVLQLEDKKNVWNKHRSMFRYCCDKKERQHIFDAHPDSNGSVPLSMTLVVRSEVLNLTRTHLAYARNPSLKERIERLPIIRPGKFLLSCIRQKAVKNLQRKVDSYRQEREHAEVQQRVSGLMLAAATALQAQDPTSLASLPQAMADKAMELQLDVTAAQAAGHMAVAIAHRVATDYTQLSPSLNSANVQLVQTALQTVYDKVVQEDKTPDEARHLAMQTFLLGHRQHPLLGAATVNPPLGLESIGRGGEHTSRLTGMTVSSHQASGDVVSAVPLNAASAHHMIPSTSQVMQNLNTVASMTASQHNQHQHQHQHHQHMQPGALTANRPRPLAPDSVSRQPAMHMSTASSAASDEMQGSGVAIDIDSNGLLIPPAIGPTTKSPQPQLSPVVRSVPLSATSLPIVKTMPLSSQQQRQQQQHQQQQQQQQQQQFDVESQGQPDAKRAKPE